MYSLPNKQYVKRQNKKSKEVDVIAHDIEADEKKLIYMSMYFHVSDTCIMIWPAITLVFA